jgi:hypothetical protein
MEQVREHLPELRAFHDFFEDRSIMANQEIAKFLADQFSAEGVKVFSDFAKALEEAKRKS